ncbi:MAG TPA: hypothetical protein VIW69_11010, partial [Candidatus Elarobacter sp.]
QVVVDLTPADNTPALQDGNADGYYDTINGQTYVINYTYVGASKNIASIAQSDGTRVEFGYAGNRVTTITQRMAAAKDADPLDPLDRQTKINYVSATQTTVTDPLGRVMTYTLDSAGRVVRVQSPSVGGAILTTDYAYNTNGDVTSITEDPIAVKPSGLNRVRTMTYDTQGNLLATYDSAGDTVLRTYSPVNQLQTETRYTGRDADGVGTASAPTGATLTTRYAYDVEQHLRFVVSADGRVTEHRYNAVGQRVLTLRYTGAVYDVSALAPSTALSETQLASWASTQDQTKLERLDYAYDFRGQLSSTSAWNTTTSAGAGSGTASITRFIYDQRGNLLQTIDPRGEGTADPNDYVTSYTYDGLGRLLTTTEWIAGGVTRTTTAQYDDAGSRTIAMLANGLVTTSTYNGAGQLISVANSGPGAVALGTTMYKYDGNGELRMVVDPSGIKQFYLYDEAWRRVAQVDGDGSLTELIYNAASQLVKTVRYSVLIDSTTLASLVDPSGNPTNVALSALKSAIGRSTGAAASDPVTRNVYNNAGQLQYTIDEAGAVTERVYDGAGRVTDTVQYATTLTIPINVVELRPTLTARQLVDPAATTTYNIGTDATNDRRIQSFYDGAGNLLGTLDAEFYVTENRYNAAGELTQTIAYANQVPATSTTNPTLRTTGALAELIAAAGADNETAVDPEQDATTYFFYDGQRRMIGALDAEGFLGETQYDVAGNVTQRIRYDHFDTSGNSVGTLTYASGDTLASIKSRVPAAAVRHTTTYVYDGLRRVVQEKNFEGTVTTKTYDVADDVVSSTRASGNEARTTQARYDAVGRVTQA